MDFALCRNIVPPAPWFELANACDFKLFINPETGRNAEWCATNHGLALAYGTTRELKNITAWHNKGGQISALSNDIGGSVAGVVIEPHSIIVFRDQIGLIPLVNIQFKDPQKCVITTSPELTNELTIDRRINPKWLAQYLSGRWNDSVEDVMDNVFRLLPGELFCIRSGNIARHQYWPKPSFFRPLEITDIREAEATLREAMVEAVGRIPEERRSIYTLSGGLDSPGIVGITCAKYLKAGQHIQTVSLISNCFPSCDESKEIGILEKELPIVAHYINMDCIKPLSAISLYHCDAFGPTLSPGLENALTLFRYVAKNWPNAQLITGYGGNFIVDLSDWSHFYDLTIRKDIPNLCKFVKTIDTDMLRTIAKNSLSGICEGKLRYTIKTYMPQAFKKFIFASEQPSEFGKRWIKPTIDQYAKIISNQRSLAQDRLFMIRSWDSELRMRSLDRIIRATHVDHYDPLFDPKLYETCARLPATLYEPSEPDRMGYRNALRPFLPQAILDHPKIQNFEAVSRFDHDKDARARIDHALATQHRPEFDQFIQIETLKHAWENYSSAMQSFVSYDTRSLFWRSISLFL